MREGAGGVDNMPLQISSKIFYPPDPQGGFLRSGRNELGFYPRLRSQRLSIAEGGGSAVSVRTGASCSAHPCLPRLNPVPQREPVEREEEQWGAQAAAAG